MPVEFRCPIHHEPLDRSDPTRWVGVGHGEVYPVIDGIPILLPDRAERERVAQTDWSKPVGTSQPIDFYNDARFETIYSRDTHHEGRATLQNWLEQSVAPDGPVLEIGSGRGALQGIGSDYVALDYAFTALRRNIDPKHTRVCGTAEHLPFADGSIAFLFTIDALEHVPRADLSFAEIERVLMPGGIAYLLPAWHCVQYVCDGVRKRPYRDLNLPQKLAKLMLPIRTKPVVKAMGALPARVARRMTWTLSGARPTTMRYRRLRAEYEQFWESDCDACTRIDSHEGVLFFKSRGYELLNPAGGVVRQLLTRHEPVVVRKPRADVT